MCRFLFCCLCQLGRMVLFDTPVPPGCLVREGWLLATRPRCQGGWVLTPLSRRVAACSNHTLFLSLHTHSNAVFQRRKSSSLYTLILSRAIGRRGALNARLMFSFPFGAPPNDRVPGHDGGVSLRSSVERGIPAEEELSTMKQERNSARNREKSVPVCSSLDRWPSYSNSGRVWAHSGRVRAHSGHVRAHSGHVRTFSGRVCCVPRRVHWVPGRVHCVPGRVRTLSGHVRKHSGHVWAHSGRVRAHS